MNRLNTAVFILLVGFNAYGEDETNQIEKISIHGQTPISPHGNEYYLLGTVQQIDSDTINRSNAMSLTEQMNSSLASLNINDVQNNPFQPDVQYRGFTASPLLGLPQGLSVYLNGVRFNEPFGDTVNWDLLSLSSIENVTLFSGSNPIFGQNTLGGALSLTTKNGFDIEHNEVSIQVGSFGQKQVNAQLGGSNEQWAYYINANRYQEDGWRDGSPSDIKQLLVNLSYRSPNLITDLFIAANDNKMVGNGAVPIELLSEQSSTAIYTQPDQTKTQLGMIGLNFQTNLSSNYSLNGNMYYRQNKIASINGDDSDYLPCMFNGGITLCEGGDDDENEDDNVEDVFDDEELEAVSFVGYGETIGFSDLSTIDAEEVDGTRNTGKTDNNSYGFTTQLARSDSFTFGDNELILGIGADKASIDFASDSEFATLHNDTIDDDRSVSGVGLYDSDSKVRLKTNISYYYLYLANSIELHNDLSFNLAARYNKSQIRMNDLIDSGPGSLDGIHNYHHFNPALGLSYSGLDNLTLKASYSQSSRTPSPAELSCADEKDPCKLPNGFVSDPPLDQVIVTTTEVGAIYNKPNQQYSFTFYSSISENDIIFQQAGNKPSQGYFVNIDKTKRQGFELSSLFRIDDYRLSANYNFLDATFESPYVSFSPVNPQGANRQVNSGDTIPGQPKHQVKILIERDLTEDINIGGEFLYSSSQYYRGDEANENSQIKGRSVVNLYANYGITPNLELSVRINNLLNKQYYTFGTYGESEEVLEDIYPEVDSVEFVGPAKPRSFAITFSYLF